MAVAFVLSHAGAGAVTLAQAYEAALSADPKYRADRFERDAALFAVPLARSQLLPAVSYSASFTRYNGHRDVPGPAGDVRQDLHYDAPVHALNLKLSLYSAENLRRYDQAKKQAEYSEAVFVTREVDLIDRLGNAYLQVLLSAEELRLNEAQVAAFDVQSSGADRRYRSGEGTRTEIAESQARLDNAVAARIDTRTALAVARATLRNMIGQDPGELSDLHPDFLPQPVTPGTLDEWLDIAYANSPMLAARRLAVEVAELEVRKARAGHLPRLDLIAGVTRSRSESVSTLDQDLRQKFLGLQLNVPLYAGGYVSALTQQAVANLERTRADLETERNTIEINVRRAFLACENALGRIMAYRSAVTASGIALEGTRRAFTAGLRTNVEVLDAQRLVFVSRRELAQNRFDYLLARLRLQSASGVRPALVIDDISGLLNAGP
jgi:protease secretion system outer membrane protein